MDPRDRKPDYRAEAFWRWAIKSCEASPTVLSRWFSEITPNGWTSRKRWALTQFPHLEWPKLSCAPSKLRFPAEPPNGWPERAPEREPTTAELVEEDKQVARWKSRALAAERKYNRLLKQTVVHEAILEEVRDHIPRFKRPKIQAPRVKPSNSNHDAILGWADGHGGEVVDLEVMQGLNHYDLSVYCRRMQATVDTTIDLLFEHHKGTTFERLYVFDLGDSVPGDLLDDNKATNALGFFESVAFVAAVKAAALTELSAYLPVVYIAVPGNHGRRGTKMPWKQPTETADWLIASMVQLHTAGNDRIECIVPKSWSAVVEVRGHSHFLNHGYAAAKGGHGGIPWYAYLRRDGKMTAIESGQRQKIDCRWYGHIHTSAEIPKMGGSGRLFIVGSLKGGDEYALNELSEYSAPEQLLVGAHAKRRYGVSFRYPLEVDEADDKPSRYEELIP